MDLNSRHMIIPYQQLSADALQSLLEDFVTRDGTDYGQEEMSMQQKVAQLLTQLKKGELLISYNDATQSCGLVTKADVVSIET